MSDYDFYSGDEEDDCRDMGTLLGVIEDNHDNDSLLSSSDDEALPAPSASPIYQHTQRLVRDLDGQNLCQKVLKVLEVMQKEGLDLPLFLNALSWGDAECTSNPKVKYARTALLGSQQLPRILKRWHNPPRDKQSKGARPAGAHQTLEAFAIQCVSDRIKQEMDSAAALFKIPGNHVTEENLVSIHLSGLQEEASEMMPVFWSILEAATRNKINKNRECDKMYILNIMAQCQYSRSNRRSKLQKLWAIYLKACGMPARAFDAIHDIGISMSHRWALDAFEILSSGAMDRVCVAVKKYPWHISHDNVNFPMRVFSQRLHNQSHFISGTAGTVWQLPAQAQLSADVNRKFNTYRAEHSHTVFAVEKILYGNTEADVRMEKWFAYHILSLLLNTPDFAEYMSKSKDSLAFAEPLPTHKLMNGADRVVKQHILGTCATEEASYDGTMKVIDEFFHQLHLSTDKEKKNTGEERFIPWLGDQMTVDRLRGMWNYRHEDHNSYDRMDYMLPVFGWFHLVMTFANSLHKQYLMNSATIGSLRQAFDVLHRKGLILQSTKGPFWHNLDEAIHHIAEAHFRTCWLAVGEVDNLKDLTKKSPLELKEMSFKIVQEHASQQALFEMQSRSAEEKDLIQIQWTMWNKDVLPYIELRHAIRAGDVGRMEDLLPLMAFRFSGGGNTNYTTEVLELFQGLNQEWSKEVCDHIRQWCWVMTRTGEPKSFLPYDLAQEQNIADIKVHYRSMGPGASMDYLKKISPAIPTLRCVQRHMEHEFGTYKRGSHHSAPQKEADVILLTTQYVESALHMFKPGRTLPNVKGSTVDIVDLGAQGLEGVIKDWFKRRSLRRSTEEIWNDGDGNAEDNQDEMEI